MSAVLYSDGDPWSISWSIHTDTKSYRESRTQAGIYRGKVSVLQARFMAMHVGLFWGIGVFAIKNGDRVDIVVNDPLILSYIKSGFSGDEFIDRRIYFVNMLIEQRKLDVSFMLEPGK